MLVGLGLGFMLPQQVYLFLVSSGGFAILFSYVIILATHYKLRKENGCPPSGECQLPGYPITSWLALVSCLLIIASMPLVAGQGAGLVAGLVLVIVCSVIYNGRKLYQQKVIQARQGDGEKFISPRKLVQRQEAQFEMAKEVTIDQDTLQRKDKEKQIDNRK